MPDVRVVVKSEGIKELLDTPEVTAELTRHANSVAATAQGIAPRVSGAYAASIGVEVDPTAKRSRVKVVADIAYAQSVEADHLTLTTALGGGG